MTYKYLTLNRSRRAYLLRALVPIAAPLLVPFLSLAA